MGRKQRRRPKILMQQAFYRQLDQHRSAIQRSSRLACDDACGLCAGVVFSVNVDQHRLCDDHRLSDVQDRGFDFHRAGGFENGPEVPYRQISCGHTRSVVVQHGDGNETESDIEDSAGKPSLHDSQGIVVLNRGPRSDADDAAFGMQKLQRKQLGHRHGNFADKRAHEGESVQRFFLLFKPPAATVASGLGAEFHHAEEVAFGAASAQSVQGERCPPAFGRH